MKFVFLTAPEAEGARITWSDSAPKGLEVVEGARAAGFSDSEIDESPLGTLDADFALTHEFVVQSGSIALLGLNGATLLELRDRPNALESLLSYVQEHERVCPMPNRWNSLWELLPNRRRVGGSWDPPPPLILAAWSFSSALDKRIRLIGHIHYAEANGTLAEVDRFLRALPESQWAHFGDL